MFCPKCGCADQQKGSYCRNCGTFLPDFDKAESGQIMPEEHLKANTVLTFMSAFVSLTLAILLYSFFLGRENTPPIIYLTAGFLLAMFAWQVQIIVRTFLLKKHFKKREDQSLNQSELRSFEAAETRELLNEPDFTDKVPASVVEKTTRKLKIER